MNGKLEQGSLELEVTDFGPIVKAKIDLRPLTVFVGPSNTGKSYLAILIYALHQFFGGERGPGHRYFSRNLPMFGDGGDKKLPKKTIDALVELAEQMVADKGRSSFEKDIVLPDFLTGAIGSGFVDQNRYLGKEIRRCFGTDDAGVLVRKSAKYPAGIVFRKDTASASEPIDHRLMITGRESKFTATIPKGTQMRIGAGDNYYPIGFLRRMAMEVVSTNDREGERRFPALWLLEALIHHVRPQIVGPLHLRAFYLPADRTGVMHAHSVVVSALIDRRADGGLRPAAHTPMLSGVLADFLKQLIVLGGSP